MSKKYSKEDLDNALGKMRVFADEVKYISESVRFESGPNGVTDRAVIHVRSMKEELDRMNSMLVEIAAQVERGQ